MTGNTTQTLTRPEHPVVIAGTQPSRSSSAGDVVLAYLRIQAHALRSLEPRVRADEFDSVHQMRIATRRLRATLRTFGQVIPSTDSVHLAAELQWLGRTLGHARDCGVLAGHLRDSLAPTPPELLIGPVQARVQGHYAPRRAVGKQARRFAKRMKRVQSVLGDHQDAVLARQAARDLGIGAHLAGENAFTYGLLYELELHRTERRQADARLVWRRASRAKYRRWMS
jgi:CHAD domain-containing protein